MSAAPETARGGDGRALAAFCLCCAIWSSTFLVIRVGNDTLPPLWAASLRLALAGTLLFALTFATRSALPRGDALRAAALYGLLNFGLSFCLLYWGEVYVPSGITAVFYATVPLTTALAAWALRLESPSMRRLLAALVAIAGVGLLFSSELGHAVPLAPLLGIVGAATSASMSSVVLKLGPRQHPLGVNAVGALVGLPVCLAASFLAHEAHPLPTASAGLFPLLYLTLAGSLGAFMLFAWLVNRWPVTRLSFIAVVVPVVATALGVIVRHEPVTPTGLAGSAIVLGGLVLGMTGGDRAAH